MRKYILLLLFVCSLNIFATKLPPAPQPEALQDAVNTFIDAHKNDKSVTRLTYFDGADSPMSHFMSIPFCCDSKDDKLNAIINAFVTDENNCYQYVHETPGSGLLYSVSFGERRHITRQNKNQEFYMLCVKNLTNPRFRDMYALAFVKRKNGKEHIYEGTLYCIKSPRPDYKEDEAKDAISWQNYFIVGQMDKELSDSIRCVHLTKGLKSLTSMGIAGWRENVVDGRFVYKDRAYKDTEIQVSYIYKNGKKSDGQTIKVTPGTTLYITFHKDSYDIDRVEKEYADDENREEKQKMEKTEETLKAYSMTLKTISEQIRELRTVPENAPDYADVKKRLSALHKSAKDITNKMQELVEKVAKELE